MADAESQTSWRRHFRRQNVIIALLLIIAGFLISGYNLRYFITPRLSLNFALLNDEAIGQYNKQGNSIRVTGTIVMGLQNTGTHAVYIKNAFFKPDCTGYDECDFTLPFPIIAQGSPNTSVLAPGETREIKFNLEYDRAFKNDADLASIRDEKTEGLDFATIAFTVEEMYGDNIEACTGPYALKVNRASGIKVSKRSVSSIYPLLTQFRVLLPGIAVQRYFWQSRPTYIPCDRLKAAYINILRGERIDLDKIENAD